MIDNRIHTFLKLCEIGNYRKTAEILCMTQPAVTQHIHFLEEQYGCKLFEYKDRKLYKTEQCLLLEKHALATVYNEGEFKRELSKEKVRKIAIGATKTVGEYFATEKITKLLKRDELQIEFVIDNTRTLLAMLNNLKLDLLMVEGNFDKSEYGFGLIEVQKLVGICSADHPFAGRVVSLEELFSQHIILREEGSGTRNVFENFLAQNSFTVGCFARYSEISSFAVIEKAIESGAGVSFVYESIPKSNKNLATFTLDKGEISHEFNFVYLKNADVGDLVSMLL